MKLSSQSCRRAVKRCFSGILTSSLIFGCIIGLVFLFADCAPPFNMEFLGVTAGGAQDIAFARQVIEDGEIPSPEAITVEGFLSEHSIPAPPVEDPGLVYATALTAWNDDFDAFTPQATIQIGLGTSIDREGFQREPQNLCLVIDRSGSMNDTIEERSGATKWDAIRIAIDRLLAHLDASDRISIVSFARRTKVNLENTPGDDIAAVKSALDKVTPEGSTNLLRGMRKGYSVVGDYHSEARIDRIIVFTDALPTAGERESEEFLEVMQRYAGDDIGTTIFGVGVDFGHDLAYDISQVRGGNYFFLSDYDRIVSVFDEEFDYLVTPIAYDVSLVVSVPFTFDVADVYGIPFEDQLTHSIEISVPTLFLSSREGGGAVFIRLRPGAQVDFTQENVLGEMTLTYTSPEGEESTASLNARLPAGLDPQAQASYFESDGVRRGVLLLNTALVMRSACEDLYRRRGDYYYYSYYPSDEDVQRATDRLTEFLPYFDALADGLEDQVSPTSRTLSQERALLEQLLENVRIR